MTASPVAAHEELRQIITAFVHRIQQLRDEPNRLALLLVALDIPTTTLPNEALQPHETIMHAASLVEPLLASSPQILAFPDVWNELHALLDAMQMQSQVDGDLFRELLDQNSPHLGGQSPGEILSLQILLSCVSLFRACLLFGSVENLQLLQSAISPSHQTTLVFYALCTVMLIIQAAIENATFLTEVVEELNIAAPEARLPILHARFNNICPELQPALPLVADILVTLNTNIYSYFQAFAYSNVRYLYLLASILRQPPDVLVWFHSTFIAYEPVVPALDVLEFPAVAPVAPDAPEPAGEFIGADDAGRESIMLIIDQQPPSITTKNKNLSPAPVVRLALPDNAVPDYYWVNVVLVRVGTADEIQQLSGTRTYQIQNGVSVEFQRLKITQTCLLERCSHFYLKFQLMRGLPSDRRIVPGVHVFSEPVKVHAHSKQVAAEEDHVVPQLDNIFPHYGPREGGNLIIIVGRNILPAADLSVEFGPFEIRPVRCLNGWVEFVAPVFLSGYPTEFKVALVYSDSMTRSANTLAYQYQ
eukprot:TRINITY_DN18853_c0_g1_i1.p1 TRINITY_DN18853_c0_g1~~TRINITY_DN18853_c0_g1_i1.p1  ORF type:complete len:532 (-),score=104.99 TRINITY_DN18853_c0_g1_i1:36-1631(-)